MNESLFVSPSADLPRVGNAERLTHGLDQWREHASILEDTSLRDFACDLVEDPTGRQLLEAIFSNSPFLARCILDDIGFFKQLLTLGPEHVLGQILDSLKKDSCRERDRERLMNELRVARRHVALLVAVADLTDHWVLERVTESLSEFADGALSAVVSHLLIQAAARGDIAPVKEDSADEDCGYVILAMGKYGARELNYSSDIDLIVLYDPMKIDYRGKRTLQHAVVRMTQELVAIMSARTTDGYVCRVDLRLRPDPGATPIAIAYSAALTYYLGRARDWERAAMIKARPVAGDLSLGRQLLAELTPFVWRNELDFWTIRAIQSIKRQIYKQHGGGQIGFAGHNIKLGRGGIREIEFFAQALQLIYGGRDPYVRCTKTVDALATLAEAGWVELKVAEDLIESYEFLRQLEHRLQMVDDQQTQTMPTDESAIRDIAAFMSFDSADRLRETLLGYMSRVDRCYAEVFEQAPVASDLSQVRFDSGEPNSKAVETLSSVGFSDAPSIVKLLRNWHSEGYPATQDRRSRDLLIELTPAILEAFGKTAGPDTALKQFDVFLRGLSDGSRFFSLVVANPSLLALLAEIMSIAPAIARELARQPELLDTVLAREFFGIAPNSKLLKAHCVELLSQARSLENAMQLARRWVDEHRFQLQVNVLRHAVNARDAGLWLSDILDAVLCALLDIVRDDLSQAYGRISHPNIAVIALGKFADRDITVCTEIHLVFVSDDTEFELKSNGVKLLDGDCYLSIFAQRYFDTAKTVIGDGRVAAINIERCVPETDKACVYALSTLDRYCRAPDRTRQRATLARARIIGAPPALNQRVTELIHAIGKEELDSRTLMAELAEQRTQRENKHSVAEIWNLEHRRGGLAELRLLAQHSQSGDSAMRPNVRHRVPRDSLEVSSETALVDESRARRLMSSAQLLRELQNFLHATAGDSLKEDLIPDGLKLSLARVVGQADFETTKKLVEKSTEYVHEAFVEITGSPVRMENE